MAQTPHHRGAFGDDPFGRFAEKTARFFGTPNYIVGQTIVVVLWIVLNSVALIHHWDPSPFIMLNLIFSTLGVNCVIDVGAHVGEFYQLLRHLGYVGRVVSFEPVPESFAKLKRVAATDPHWRGYNVALGHICRPC